MKIFKEERTKQKRLVIMVEHFGFTIQYNILIKIIINHNDKKSYFSIQNLVYSYFDQTLATVMFDITIFVRAQSKYK